MDDDTVLPAFMNHIIDHRPVPLHNIATICRYGEDVEELLRRMRKEIKSLQQNYEVCSTLD